MLEQVGISQAEVEEMYRVMAIANYEDRFVIPTTHREYAENTFNVRGGCGFTFGNGCSDGTSETSLFGSEKKRDDPDQGGGLSMFAHQASGSDDHESPQTCACWRRCSPTRMRGCAQHLPEMREALLAGERAPSRCRAAPNSMR